VRLSLFTLRICWKFRFVLFSNHIIVVGLYYSSFVLRCTHAWLMLSHFWLFFMYVQASSHAIQFERHFTLWPNVERPSISTIHIPRNQEVGFSTLHTKVKVHTNLCLWRLHTMPGWRFQILYCIGYFQLISLDSQQSLATQSHGLSTLTAIVWSGLELNHAQSRSNLY